MFWLLSLFFQIFFYCCSITFVSIFPISLSCHTHPNSHSQSSPCYPCPWVIYTCSLTRPFSFFLPFSCNPSSLVSVSLFLVSMPLVLFCSLVYFVHYILLIGEIIWYLSFTNWLISFSVIFSSSTHAVAKYRSFFFCCIVFHCVNVPVSWSTHLLMGT